MMPAYSFQSEFVPKIVSLSKVHTIRKIRAKRPTRLGDPLYFYTGMRTKQCRLIAVSQCIKIEPIEIHAEQRVLLNGQWLNYLQVKELAEHDGFVSVLGFFKFFEDHYDLPTEGFELIHWSTELLTPARDGNGREIRLQLGGEK